MASTTVRTDHLVWEQTEVQGRTALYGSAGRGGDGLPVLFLHGWALGQHSYKRPLSRLVRMGCRVYAPAQPGFGGTPDLPDDQFTFSGYAAWAADFLDAVGVKEPALVIGHSFGGGVAIQLAHDHPTKVQSLVLVNSIGGSGWSRAGSTVRSIAERPLWDWGLHFRSDILPLPQLTKVLPVVFEDAVSNLVRNPLGLWRVANLARHADLTAELEELKRRALPVVVLWGNRDSIVPKESFTAMCAALGSEGEVVNGNHSWLLSDPDAFGEVITNVVSVAKMSRAMEEGAGSRRGGLLGLVRRRPRKLATVAGAKLRDEL
jgi:pimeloyl-ACP methyl ester carboxylesterase